MLLSNVMLNVVWWIKKREMNCSFCLVTLRAFLVSLLPSLLLTQMAKVGKQLDF